MNAPLEYKGYFGSADVDIEDGVLVGRLLFIRDVVTYSALEVKGIQIAFREAVDDYLVTCEKEGSQPEVPCKGSFNVRVGAERHRSVALAARRAEVGLNDFVCSAIDAALRTGDQQTVVHRHEVNVTFVGEQPLTALTSGMPKWELASEPAKH